MSSWAEYDELVSRYRRMEIVKDGSEFWWDIRPAAVFPTIEMRICDICTRIEDAVCMAALYASLVRRLLRQCRAGDLPPEPPTELLAENRWIAQRYGVLAFFGDPDKGGRIDIADYAARLVEELTEDARALDCEAELSRVLAIVRDGAGRGPAGGSLPPLPPWRNGRRRCAEVGRRSRRFGNRRRNRRPRRCSGLTA